MENYILRLKYTQIELPPSQKQYSKDFPKAKVRVNTPKHKKTPMSSKAASRSTTPRDLSPVAKHKLTQPQRFRFSNSQNPYILPISSLIEPKYNLLDFVTKSLNSS